MAVSASSFLESGSLPVSFIRSLKILPFSLPWPECAPGRAVRLVRPSACWRRGHRRAPHMHSRPTNPALPGRPFGPEAQRRRRRLGSSQVQKREDASDSDPQGLVCSHGTVLSPDGLWKNRSKTIFCRQAAACGRAATLLIRPVPPVWGCTRALHLDRNRRPGSVQDF